MDDKITFSVSMDILKLSYLIYEQIFRGAGIPEYVYWLGC